MEVPAALSGAIAKRDRVAPIAAELIRTLETRLPDESQQVPLQDAILCDHRRDRVKAWIRLGLTPTPGDYQAMPLPRPLWPIYYVTRPLRLATKAALRR